MSNFKTIAAAMLATAAFAGAAQAGGFSRGSANIGMLLDEGTTTSFGMTFVDPTRKDENGIDTAASYMTFDAAVGVQMGDAKCGFTYAQPFGLSSDETKTALAPLNAKTDTATSDELGLTCAYGFDVGPVKAFVLGGLFYQTLNYKREYFAGAITPTLSLSDGSFGYRIGIGVAKPEIALKATLVYRSEVKHSLEGNLTAFGIFPSPPLPAPFTAGIARASLTTPQSVKLSVQSGIAPGWLAFGSVEWTDWSVLQINPVFIDGIPAASLNSGFKDGWTITAGVGHAVTEQLSVAASIIWDQGVSAGYAPAGGQKISPSFGSFTLGVGAGYNFNENVTLRGSFGYTWLNGGTFFDLDDKKVKVYPNGSAIAGGLTLNVKF